MLVYALVFCTAAGTCQVATTNVTKEICETQAIAANKNTAANGSGVVFKCMSKHVETYR